MIEIIPKKEVVAASLRLLRDISSKSISEIKRASKIGAAIRSFEIFGRNWETERVELVRIHGLAKSFSEVPFVFYDPEFSEELSLEEMKSKFEFWRSIELETQRNCDLENGCISSPEDFEPHDDEWA
ncbi:MAG: hypothetical protein OIF51_17075 [Cellvibrionaceae bacterium]|nr:hypothetical protein [Cellvibrionaceae bacterium]